MATMNVGLSDEFVASVEGEIALGEYASASKVVRDALRLLRREKALDEKIQILRREVGVGVEQGRSGHLSKRTVGEIVAELDANNQAPS